MERLNMPDELIKKVESAAKENFRKYDEQFEKLRPEDLFKIAYQHGYNCAYNIYDVAEERVDGFIKSGEVPEKDIPVISFNEFKNTEQYINENRISITSSKQDDVYISGYQKGFKDAWGNFGNMQVGREIKKLVDYYMSGKKD